jgi:hypothetical protein
MEQPKFNIIHVKTGKKSVVTKTWLDIATKHGFIKDYDVISQVNAAGENKIVSHETKPEPIIEEKETPKGIEYFGSEKNTPEQVQTKKRGRKPKQK